MTTPPDSRERRFEHSRCIERPTIAYIAGYGRSGSTLLDICLGSVSGVAGVGELVNIFPSWALSEPDATTNGFWADVYRRFFKRIGMAEATERERRKYCLRLGRIQFWLESVFSRLYLTKLFRHSKFSAEYAHAFQALYAVIAEESGAQLIVDSSKTAWRSAFRPVVLAGAGFDVRVIHLVRDGRAVMWSFLRGDNVKMERGDSDTAMSLPRTRAVIGWIAGNVVVPMQARHLTGGETIKVRYCDLASDPLKELTRIGEFLRIDIRDLTERLESRLPLKASLQFSGNRVRRQGIVGIKPDDEWRDNLSLFSKAYYWIFAWPFHYIICK